MTTLKDLDVSHNVLKRLPDVSYWTSDTLRKLNLAHNKVSIMCNNRERVEGGERGGERGGGGGKESVREEEGQEGKR